MAVASKIHFLVLLISLLCQNSAQALAYTISQADNTTDNGIVITPGNPLILQNGDTLTLSNNKNINITPATGSCVITAYGNNTITVNTGSSIASTQNVVPPPAANTNIINFVGNGSSTIVVATGATLQAGIVANTAAANANIFTSINEKVTLANSGTLVGYAYFNNITVGSSNLVLLGTTLSVANQINTQALNSGTGVCNLWVGGQLDAQGVETITATTYNSTTDYYPFTNVRVFAGSTMTLSGQTFSGPAVTNNLTIDATASFTLTGASPAFPVTPPPIPTASILVINNLQNAGTLTVANTYTVGGTGGFRTLSVGILENSGQTSVINGSQILGIDQTLSTLTNAPASSMNITSGTLSGFNILTNQGILTVNDTLSKINTINNNSGGLITLMAGASIANIGSINNASGASFNFSGAVLNDDPGLANNQNLAIVNQGGFTLSSGMLKFASFINNGLLTLNGGDIEGYSMSTIVNNFGARFNATGGAISNMLDLTNYGILDLSGVTINSTLTNLYNYYIVNHTSGALAATNLYNKSGAIYNLTDTGSITPPGGSITITNQGTMNVNTTGFIYATMINGVANSLLASSAVLNITNLPIVYNIINNATLNINGPLTIAPLAVNIAAIDNNQDIVLNNAEITVGTVTASHNKFLNNATGNIDVLGSLTFTFPPSASDDPLIADGCNFTSYGIVSLKGVAGVITYENTGTNIFYIGPNGTLKVLASNTLTASSGTVSYANHGTHYAFINSVADPSTLIIDGNADLKNCFISFDVNANLTGNYSFKILDCVNITQNPAGFRTINTFLLKKSIVYNSSLIFAEYFRQSLVDPVLQLSPNAQALAQAIETLLSQKQMSDVNLNSLYQTMYSNVNSAAELEVFLTNMLPIVSTPIQNAVVQQAVFNQLDSRMHSTRIIAYNGGDYLIGFTPWVRYFATNNRQDQNAGTIGYQFNSHGVVFGLDNYDGINNQYGLSITFARSALHQHSKLPSKSRTHFYQANIYSQDIRQANWYTDWIIGLAYSDTKQYRFDPTYQNSLAYSHYQWQQYSGKYEVGYVYDFSKELYVIPYLSGNYTFLKSYKYQEYGNGPDSLYIQSPSKHIIDSGLGVRAAMQFLLYKKTLTPKINLGMKYSLTSPLYIMDASIIDQNIIFKTVTKLPRLRYFGGVGATLEVVEDLNLSANLDLEAYDNYLGISYNLLLRYTF